MEYEEAIAALSSSDAERRLKGARFLASCVSDIDLRPIRAALAQETVPWVKRALDRVLNRTHSQQDYLENAVVEQDPSDSILAQNRAAAIDEVATTIIHELSGLVGRLRVKAPIEVNKYSESATKNIVDTLAHLLTGIRSIKTAAGKPFYSQMDLALECREACRFLDGYEKYLRFAGPSPFMTEIDPGLFKLALTNVVRNAVEALSLIREDEREIIINWGRGGHEIWVSVIDNGPGFDGEPSSLIQLGKSTKNEHFGFGLATARQAMQTMEGDLYPSNASGGGARIELRWLVGDENTVR